MSDINSVAETMGIPADLVARSAAARATESGTTTEDVLEAWGGGGSVAPAAPSPESEPEQSPDSPEPEPTLEETPEAPEPVAPAISEPPQPSQQSELQPSLAESEPPVLVGARDNPWAVVTGAVGLFLGVLVLGLIGPSLPSEMPGARTSEIAFSEAGETGREIYQSQACAACHTQMIRPVIADVGLGQVTLDDSNQVLGVRRFGPDLADVGGRLSGAEMEAIISGSGGHPGHSLGSEDMSALVTYLLESSPSSGAGS